MSTEEKRAVVLAVKTDIAAFEADIRRTGPRKDYYGNLIFDVRLAHLTLLRSALAEVEKINPT